MLYCANVANLLLPCQNLTISSMFGKLTSHINYLTSLAKKQLFVCVYAS